MPSTALIHLQQCKDPHLPQIIETIPLPEVETSSDLFYDLVSCVVDQQVPHRSRGTYLKKLRQLMNDAPISPESIRQVREEQFAEFKLSNSKFLTLMRLVESWEENQLGQLNWQQLSDAEVKIHLGSIKGIGNWTTDMILLFSLERPDVFPYEDYHLKNMMVQLYELNPKSKLKAQMLEIAEDWAPYRSLAVKYLLAWKVYLKKGSL